MRLAIARIRDILELGTRFPFRDITNEHIEEVHLKFVQQEATLALTHPPMSQAILYNMMNETGCRYNNLYQV